MVAPRGMVNINENEVIRKLIDAEEKGKEKFSVYDQTNIIYELKATLENVYTVTWIG